MVLQATADLETRARAAELREARAALAAEAAAAQEQAAEAQGLRAMLAARTGEVQAAEARAQAAHAEAQQLRQLHETVCRELAATRDEQSKSQHAAARSARAVQHMLQGALDDWEARCMGVQAACSKLAAMEKRVSLATDQALAVSACYNK